MKPLILSFFAVILSYSLFFDEEKELEHPALNPNTAIHSELDAMHPKSDTIDFYMIKPFSQEFHY